MEPPREPAPTARRARNVLLAVLGSLGVAALLVLAFRPLLSGTSGREFRSDPDAVRPWAEDDFDRTCAPVPSPQPARHQSFALRLSPPEWKASQTPGNPEELHFEFERAEGEFVPRYEVVTLDAGSPAGAEVRKTGRIGLEWLATGFIDALPEGKRYLPLTAYGPRLEPADDPSALGIDPHELRQHLSSREQAGIAFKAKVGLAGLDEAQWKFRGVFDRATKVKVTRGATWSNRQAGCTFGSRLEIVHATPLRAVLDFTHGPARVVEVAPQTGAAVEGPAFKLELAAFVPGTSHGNGSASNSQNRETRWLAFEAGSQEDSCTAVFVVSPAIMEDAISIEAVDGEGNAVARRASSSGSGIETASFGAPPSKVAAFRVTYRPHFVRLLIDLPVLPGLPPQNVALDDLFDAHIPATTFEHEYQMREAIAHLVELDQRGSVSSLHAPGSGPFPLTVPAGPVRNLAAEYLALRPDLSAEVDRTTHTLHVYEPPTSTALERASEIVRNLWPF